MNWRVETLRQKFSRKMLMLSSDTNGDLQSPMNNHAVALRKNNVRLCAKPLVSLTTAEIMLSTSAISVGNKSDFLLINGSNAPAHANR
jgi:hypothetical protein